MAFLVHHSDEPVFVFGFNAEIIEDGSDRKRHGRSLIADHPNLDRLIGSTRRQGAGLHGIDRLHVEADRAAANLCGQPLLVARPVWPREWGHASERNRFRSRAAKPHRLPSLRLVALPELNLVTLALADRQVATWMAHESPGESRTDRPDRATAGRPWFAPWLAGRRN